jgi:hypothetical protein
MINTSLKILQLIKDDKQNEIIMYFATDYFIKQTPNYVEIRFKKSKPILSAFKLPEYKDAEIEYINNNDAVVVKLNIINKIDTSSEYKDIHNGCVEFYFLKKLGTDKIVDFDVNINSLLNIPIMPLKN